jgi:hypothetical protein
VKEKRIGLTSGTYRQLVGKLAANVAAPPTLATYDVSVQG